MLGMLFLMFVQSMFQFAAKGGWKGYYGEKNYLDRGGGGATCPDFR